MDYYDKVKPLRFIRWYGDHYEQMNPEFCETLPDNGFYLYFDPEQHTDDATLFMGHEL